MTDAVRSSTRRSVAISTPKSKSPVPAWPGSVSPSESSSKNAVRSFVGLSSVDLDFDLARTYVSINGLGLRSVRSSESSARGWAKVSLASSIGDEKGDRRSSNEKVSEMLVCMVAYLDTGEPSLGVGECSSSDEDEAWDSGSGISSSSKSDSSEATVDGDQ